jgi:CRISPR/Cas system-associated exonuclease Cas4 (RecB family)
MIKGGRAVVVDYKFGENKLKSHNYQMANYMRLLSDMDLYDTIEGYVWYVSLGEVVKVD